jgi:hypothetical protein
VPGTDSCASACVLSRSAPDESAPAFWIGVLDADFDVLDPPELARAVERLAARYARAAG